MSQSRMSDVKCVGAAGETLSESLNIAACQPRSDQAL
jgi:hypothetical protein